MSAQAVNELMEIERDCYQALLEGDVDAMMDRFLADEAIVCPPGIEAVKGRDNQRVLFKELLKIEGFELWWEPLEAQVSPSEEMGWVFGAVKWKMPGEDEIQGKYISVWIKEDGEWRNMIEIRNSNN